MFTRQLFTRWICGCAAVAVCVVVIIPLNSFGELSVIKEANSAANSVPEAGQF